MKAPHLWLAALAAAALAAVPVSAPAANAPKARLPAVYTVTLQQLKFGPVPAGLRVGDSIEWVNKDIFLHSATARDKSFDVELKPGARVRTVLTKAGAIPFSCRYHPNMTGTLVVAK
ncbi:MAG: plastocyanin [Phenylobacterium sp.]|nr:plastocyanin [Phenylobacterium sp.]